jgi:ATP-dependent Clp protease ATP-binding subunit ClpA
VFERFAAQTRASVSAALDEARRRGDRRIGTDHLLVGALRNPDVAAMVGVSAEEAGARTDELDRQAIEAIGLRAEFPLHASARGSKRAPFTSGARTVVQRALVHAVAQKSRQISPQHLLLALLEREQPDPAAALLSELKVDQAALRTKLAVQK